MFLLRYLKAAARGALAPARAARRRPWLALAVAGLVLAASAAAAGGYVRHQWHAALQDLAADRPAEARERLAVCLFVWPNDPEVHRLAARAARLSGDVKAAEDHLKRCLKLPGGRTEAVQLENLLLRVQTGEADELFPILEQWVERKHPESPLILETLARAFIHRLRYKPALACLSKWNEIRPDTARVLQWRGWVYERLNNHKAATEDYHKALKLDPDLLAVRLRVATMLLEDKRAPEAVPHMERLYRQAPDKPEVQAGLGLCRFYQNRPQEARRLMEAAVVHLPQDPALLVHLAKLDLDDGKGVEAERRLRAVLKTDPSDTEALYNLASALRLQRRTAEADGALKDFNRAKEKVDRFNKLLREVADSPTARAADYAEIGTVLISLGKDRLGVYWMEQALERDPGLQQAHKALAEHYEKKGDRQRAALHRSRLRK
jgi:tetratricopeptide (TPR) repeat protein